jgi:hypothetical protein
MLSYWQIFNGDSLITIGMEDAKSDDYPSFFHMILYDTIGALSC